MNLYPPFSLDRLAALAHDLPDDVKCYKFKGDYDAELREIDLWLSRSIPDAMRERLELEKILIDGMVGAYTLTEADLLDRLRQHYPTLPDEAMETIMTAGFVDWRLVDGEKRMLRSAPANIRKTMHSLLAPYREPKPSSGGRAWTAENVALLQERGARSFRFHVRHELSVDEPYVRPGEEITVHLPFPAETETQSGIRLLSASHEHYLSNASQRTVCFRRPHAADDLFFIEYEYVCTARYTCLDPERVTAELPADLSGLGEQYPHIRFTPYLVSLARELAGDEHNPLLCAQRFYDYITRNVRYSYVRDYRVIDQLAEFPALNLRGDCGLQAIFFITLCRIRGIPARWRSGCSINPDSIGSHDWAEFYVAPYGWLPADPSFGGAAHRSGNEERRTHYFGNLDPFRLVANTEMQEPFDPPKRFLRADPYDNQSGEAEYASGGLPEAMFTTRRRVLDAEEID